MAEANEWRDRVLRAQEYLRMPSKDRLFPDDEMYGTVLMALSLVGGSGISTRPATVGIERIVP